MKEYELIAERNQQRAREILKELGLTEYFEKHGCKVNLIGSLAMGLLVKHRDIDLHIYSSELTEEKSFAIFAGLAKNPKIKEIKCINGLFTDEHCLAWHLTYQDADGQLWQIDIIHIESGTTYDGFFEKMAHRISEVLTDDQRETIIRLKFETLDGELIHGVEYYQAVIEAGVTELSELREWVKNNRKPDGSYWMPEQLLTPASKTLSASDSTRSCETLEN
ncbi:MAG: phosphoglycerate mutase family protein [Muribaculaceae bacterium]|nr:phosphoglycerate mutase family protein [Muribaculaceae bacterium]